MADADALAQHIDLYHAAFAVLGDDALAELGQTFAKLGVGRLLVDQAALEAAALTGDLGRVQDQALVLGVLDRDRDE